MENQVMYILKLVATFSVLLPIAFGLLHFRRSQFIIRCYIFFLVAGLLVDLAGWHFYVTRNDGANIFTRHFYDLFETIFLLWFLGRVSPDRLTKLLFTRAWWIIVPFWSVRFFYIGAMPIFKISTEVFTAFAACFIILRMIEVNSQVTKQLIFWILLGIFFYCFSTYFIMGMLATHLSKIWYIHSLINIATNIIYLIGFLKLSSSDERVADKIVPPYS